MEFYFRKDGKTLGPLSVFRVREQFEESKLVATDMGWHEGMEEWKPISEIPALQILLPRSEEELAKETADQAMEDAVLDPLERLDRENDPATEAPRPATRPIRDVAMEQEIQQTILLARQRNNWAWQRFLARFIDLLFFSLLVLAAGAQFGILEWGEITIPRFVAMMAAPFIWIPVEAFCLTRWGATPGKMMLGIRVENADGSRLNFRQALSRSVDVWFVGCGMQLQYLDVLMKVLAMVRYRQLGGNFLGYRTRTSCGASANFLHGHLICCAGGRDHFCASGLHVLPLASAFSFVRRGTKILESSSPKPDYGSGQTTLGCADSIPLLRSHLLISHGSPPDSLEDFHP